VVSKGLSLSPNPSGDRVHIVTTQKAGPHHLCVYAPDGLEILSISFTGLVAHADISGFPAGIYFVRVTSDRNVETGRFIKN